MSDPYIFPQYLISGFQDTLGTLASSNRSNLNGRLQSGSLAFGLPIEVAVPSNYVNYSSFFDQSFYNPFTDSRFKKVPVRVIYSQQHDQNETSGVGQSTLYNSSVFDNNLHLSLEISNQDCIDPVSGPRASVAIIKSQLATNSSRVTNHKDACLMSDKEDRAKYEASDKHKLARARYRASDKGKRARAKYEASDKRKLARARYLASDKGKKAKAKYQASVKGKAAKARYVRSDKGKKVRAKYEASGPGKEARARYVTSDKGKQVRATYEASDKRKLGKLITNTRSNVYRAALKKGFSEEVARKKGELAANVKKAELLSASVPLGLSSRSSS